MRVQSLRPTIIHNLKLKRCSLQIQKLHSFMSRWAALNVASKKPLMLLKANVANGANDSELTSRAHSLTSFYLNALNISFSTVTIHFIMLNQHVLWCYSSGIKLLLKHILCYNCMKVLSGICNECSVVVEWCFSNVCNPCTGVSSCTHIFKVAVVSQTFRNRHIFLKCFIIHPFERN